MKTTRRNFLVSIPFLAAILGIKAEPKKSVVPKQWTPLNVRVTGNGTAGENIVAGQCLYYGPDGKIYLSGKNFAGIAVISAMVNDHVEILIQDIQWEIGSLIS